MKEALAGKKLSAIHVYRLADEDETNSISAITLKQTLQSLVPEIPVKVAFKLMRILDTNRNGFIDLHEYEIIFLKNKNDLEDIKDNDSRMEYRKSEHQSINNESVIDNNDSIMDDIGTPRDIEKREDVHSDDPAQLTKNIGKVMAENSINPEAVFDEVDQEGNGTAPLMLILKTLTEFMPEVDGVSLFRASKYMDSSKDGFIKRGDFLAALGGKKIERAPQEEKHQRPAFKPASSSVQAPVASQGQKKNQNSGAKTWEEPALLSDRQFYEKVRHLKQLLKAEGVSVESLFGYNDCKEQAVMSIATRIHECFPKLPKSEIIPILKYVDVGNNGTIQRDEFELMIGYNNKTATIDESQFFNESRIDKEAIDKIAKLTERKKMTPETLFDYCDTDKNGRTNILDAKIGLERLFQVDKNVFPAIIAFVKELKFIFKTSEFDRARFVLFMKDPTNSYIHEEYDVVRRSIEAMLKTPGQLNDAVRKLKKPIKIGPSKDLSLNHAAERFDSDKDGILSIQEFNNFLNSLKDTGISPEQKTYLCNLADKEHDGRIKIDDFIEYLRSDSILEQGS